MSAITWSLLVNLEPSLDVLREAARTTRYHGGIKDKLAELVGFMREDRHPILSTKAAYDVAHAAIFGG